MIDPRTSGLPAVNTKSRAPEGSDYFLTGGIERMTYDLHVGRAVSASAWCEAEKLVQRVDALKRAMDMRTAMQCPLIEDEPQ